MKKMRLIDADALYERIKEHHDLYVNAWGGFKNLPANDKARVDAYTCCIAEVMNSPTIDAVPVVHARWIMSDDRTPKCSHCKMAAILGVGWFGNYKLTEYCPECGARMDGEADG